MPEPHEFSRSVENLIASMRGLPTNDSRSRPRRERPIGETIDQLLRKYHIGTDAPDHTVRQHWADIVDNTNDA